MLPSDRPPDTATAASRVPRIGVVGAGRTRQGLGPFLARWFEAAGAIVTAISGRDPARTAAAAGALATQLGHPVAVCADAASLARSVDALVVASPVPGHLDGLDAALAAGVPCLCEKPLVAAADTERGLARLARFRDAGLLLTENCQWPFVLPALDELRPEWRARQVRSLAMGLGPAAAGRAMLEDSLSHVLSLAQAVADLPGDAADDVTVEAVSETDGSATAEHNVVRFRIVGGSAPIAVALHLERCPQQPRPAWFAVDGQRLDRRVDPDYAISFEGADGRRANVQDPLAALVYGFAANLKVPNRERNRTLVDAIALRQRLFARVLAALDDR